MALHNTPDRTAGLVENHTIVSTTAPNAIWNAISAFGQMAISFVATAVVSRVLGPAVMGKYFLWYWLATAGSVVANNGMAGAVSRFGAEYIGAGQQGRAISLARHFGRLQWQLACAVATLEVIITFCGTGRHDAGAASAVAAFSIALTISNAQTGVATAWQQYRLLAITRIASACVASVLMILAAVSRCAAEWLIFAQVAGAIAGVVLLRILWKPFTRAEPKAVDVSAPYNVWRYVIVTFAILLLSLLLWQRVEIVFLQLMSNAAAVGLLGIALSLAAALMRLPTALLSVLTPRFAELKGLGQHGWIQNLAANSFRYTVVLSAPVVIATAAAARPLLSFLYGPSFGAADAMFRYVVFGQFALALGHIPRSLLLATNHEHKLLICDVLLCGLVLVVQPLSITAIGPVGAAVGNVISMTALLAASARVLKRLEGITLPWITLVITCAFALACAIPVALGERLTHSWLVVLTMCSIACVLYVALCVWGRLISRTDVRRLGTLHPTLMRLLADSSHVR